MKKIDGLRLDFQSGDGDVKFSPDFSGQSAEFRLMAVSYWITSLLDEREAITTELSSRNAGFINSLFSGKSIEDLLTDGQVILLQKSDRHNAGKRFLATFISGSYKRVAIWESISRSTYVKLCDVPCMNSSIKGYMRIARTAFDRWQSIQNEIKAAGAQRLSRSAINDRTPAASGLQIMDAVRNFAAAK